MNQGQKMRNRKSISNRLRSTVTYINYVLSRNVFFLARTNQFDTEMSVSQLS